MADRTNLRNQIQTSQEKPMLGEVVNASLFTAYRVVVYRMKTSDISPISIKGVEGTRTMDYLLNLDPSNDDYLEITNAIAQDQGDELFLNVLEALYGKLKKTLDIKDAAKYTNKIKSLYRRGQLVDEFDVTPLVGNINITLDIEGMNQCSIQCIDPALSSLKNTELQRLYAQNPWIAVANHNGGAYENELVKLKNFKFREFDLIRVSAYSSLEQSFSEKVEAIKKKMKITAGNDEAVSLLTEYALLPAFTGFVQSITDNTNVNQMSTTNLGCMGVARVLAQTSTVVDQALCNQVVMKHRKLAGQMTNNKSSPTPKANVFSGDSSLEVFSKLISGSLYPKLKRIDVDDKRKNDAIAGFPSLANLYKLSQGDKDKTGLVNVIPLFPSIVALHWLKERFSELIFYCDDAVMEKQMHVPERLPPIPITSPLVSMLATLRPYMNMLKNNFELFESQYQSPWDVMSTLRQNTYMEVFEDRSGTFRFRFPKYNNAVIDCPLGFSTVASINMNRSDSNNFSIVQTRLQADLIGAMRAVVPDVFIDGLSMIRYGFRMSATIENPNAISALFSKYLGAFIKYYSTLRESRTATIALIGSPKVELGQMASFRYGYKSNIEDITAGYKNTGVSTNASVFSKGGDYVGYVTNINEVIGVDQPYQQTLTLKFIRDAQISKVKMGTEYPLNVYRTAASIVARAPGLIQEKVLPVISKLFVGNDKGTFSITSAPPPKTMPVLLTYSASDIVIGNFCYIPSALELAKTYLYNKEQIDRENAAANALLGKRKESATQEEFRANIVEIESDIDDSYRNLAIMSHQRAMFKNLAQSVNVEFLTGISTQNTTSFLRSVGKNQLTKAGGLKRWIGQGIENINNKLEGLVIAAYNDAASTYEITIPVAHEYASPYGRRAPSVSRGDYDTNVKQMWLIAQKNHNKRYTDAHELEKEIGEMAAERYDYYNDTQAARWRLLWKAYIEALEFQIMAIDESFLPFYKNKIVHDVKSIDNYNQGLKKASGEVSNIPADWKPTYK